MNAKKLDELENLLSKCDKGPFRIKNYNSPQFVLETESGSVVEVFESEVHAELFKAAIETMPELISLARDKLKLDFVREYLK